MQRHYIFAGVTLLSLAAALTPAAAASDATIAFVANIRPNIDYLDRSSRLALDKSQRPAVRSFAHDEALEQTVAANSLVAWTQTSTRAGVAVALSRPAETRDAGADLAALPREFIGSVSHDADALLTGRSVASGPAVTVTPASASDGGKSLLPAGGEDLARLRTLEGRHFDALYRSTQLDALRQLATLYRTYATSGDDPSLRALALRELPRVNGRIVALRRL